MTDTSRIFRYEVPVDDQWHIIQTPTRATASITTRPASPVVAVGCRHSGVVEFWARRDPDTFDMARAYRVYGTGHEFPARARYEGTTPDSDPRLIWHLVSVPAEPAP